MSDELSIEMKDFPKGIINKEKLEYFSKRN